MPIDLREQLLAILARLDPDIAAAERQTVHLTNRLLFCWTPQQ
jgi:hypothetical protein